MTVPILLLLWAAVVGTATLSGVFGMAGGLVLVGLLLVLLPLPEAMALHAVTQIASNAWRAGFWIGHVRWRVFAAYLAGCLVAVVGWSIIRYVPPKPVALISLGLSPFLLVALPDSLRPDPERAAHGMGCGMASMSLMLLTGVAGPLLDRFFLGGRLDRRGIIATKAACQVGGHTLKLVYFGGLVAGPGAVDPVAATGAVIAAAIGTVLARPLVEAMSDQSYRLWGGRIITVIAITYIAQGTWLLLQP